MWTTLAWTYVQDRATKMMGARPGAWLRNWRKWLQNKSLTHNTARITITRIHVIVGGIQRHYITKRRNCYVTKSPLTHRRRFLRNHKTTQRCVTRGRYFERVSSYVTFVRIRWLWTTCRWKLCQRFVKESAVSMLERKFDLVWVKKTGWDTCFKYRISWSCDNLSTRLTKRRSK